MIRLGINVDHVATLRQARGIDVPDPVEAALLAEQAGADGITVHCVKTAGIFKSAMSGCCASAFEPK